jgi:WhiB family transcriptional regulator, redox-sensing transcriptional regulator
LVTVLPGIRQLRTAPNSEVTMAELTPLTRLLGPAAARGEWLTRAACRNLDSTLFFPPDRERGVARTDRERVAKAVCARCPVLAQCRQHALANHEPFGIWGGMTTLERSRALRNPRASRVVARYGLARR